MSGDARAAILARIRGALADVPPGEPAAATPAVGGGRSAAAGAPLADLFAERVADYRATVTRCEAAEVAVVVAAVCARHGARDLACPPELPAHWLPAGFEVRRDAPPLALAELDALDGVITGAAAGIGETGTIVLDGGALSGRRALTLVPDLHICVVAAADLVATVPEGLAAVAAQVADGQPITFVSGPSATSDIELNRVEGVHGPRRLEVVLAV